MSFISTSRKLFQTLQWRSIVTIQRATSPCTKQFPQRMTSVCASPSVSSIKCLKTRIQDLEKSTLGLQPISCLGAFKGVHTSAKCHSMFEDKDTKALTVWTNLREVKKSPVPALSLGLSGLLPFVGCPLYMIGSHLYFQNIALAQVAYGASILSFLGGVRWGFTLPEDNPVQPDWVNLGYSVIPSLIAWAGLLLPLPYSLLTMIGGLVFAGYVDMAMYGYPPWFKGLRFLLTFVAVLSLWTTFMCSFMLPKEEKKSVSSVVKKS